MARLPACCLLASSVWCLTNASVPLRRQDDKRVRQIHLLWRDRGSCLGPMVYSGELAGMMSKALEQLQMFKSKVGMLTPLSSAAVSLHVSRAAGPSLCCV
jgi:hypothetical protein